ncbi:MAG: S41 family peptidase [Trueperaceae bacterium]|nr:MAG: S41 family peptidase [Trueperaceae bacterium]
MKMLSSGRSRRRIWFLASFVTAGMMLAIVYAQFSRNTDSFSELLGSRAGQAFMETFAALKTNYLTDVDDEIVLQGAITGMLEALDDPFTNYLSPEQADRNNQSRSGFFEGIGAALSAQNIEDGTGVQIVNVFRDGPAWKAGLQRGDIIVAVDGINVENATVSDVVALIRGPKGTAVEISVLRSEVETAFSVTAIRDTIEIFAVESTVLPGDIGYLRISTFANNLLHEQLIAQLDVLEAQGIRSLVLDLRDNGGGLLNQGILVADEFLNEGDIVFRRSRGVTQRIASASPGAFTLPMVVLINENSASASEIVAGALQDHGRAVVIGETSFGKGVGQSVSSLSNGGQLVLLNFEWLTPKRKSINNRGITPDMVVQDNRFPNILNFEGAGGIPGQELTISVGDDIIGTTTVREDGTYTFIQPFSRREVSDLQGEALIDPDDNILQIAIKTVEEMVQPEMLNASN